MKLIQKLVFTALTVFISALTTLAGEGLPYNYSIDLTKSINDKLKVILTPPNLPSGEALFMMPKIIPGTYSIYDFGRFIENFKAYGKDGKEITVSKKDVNTWVIPAGDQLGKIEYDVNDTWDADTANFIFEPAGTGIDEGKSYMLNTNGFFGYFGGHKSVPFTLSITKPEGFYGSTSLIAREATKDKDVFQTKDYMELMDSPILYSRPDTTMMQVGNAQVLVSVVSEKGKIWAPEIASNIKEILFAAKDYLGGQLPVDKYAFLIYLYKGQSRSGSSGALEHCTSSMYYLPEGDPADLTEGIRDIAAHEFYHIITPLTIHSEEIGNFDYNNPAMSKHLWLYEGITEYTANYVQLRQGLIDLDRYMRTMREKIFVSKNYFNDTLSFTEMSKHCLDKYQSQYGNVYMKGALIGFCLDVKLRKISDGKMGLQDVINQLSKKYGKDRSFNDETLFDEITALTYPEIRQFFRTYVEGTTPLPYEETFRLIGYEYKPEVIQKDFTLGKIDIGYDQESNMLVIAGTENMNNFGKKMGYMPGDKFVSFNGRKVEPQTFNEILTDWMTNVKEGDKLSITVLREGKGGKEKKKKLKAKVYKEDSSTLYVITPMENPSEEQKKILKAWSGK